MIRLSTGGLFIQSPDRVIPGHGAIVEGGGKRAVIEGFEWVL